MKKHMLMASLAVCSTVLAGGAFAQDGSFKDVPNDHWSYAAIEKLTSLNPKVFIGDPDGQFRGKRNLTRYEMAVIIARLLENIESTYAKKGDVRTGGGEGPDVSGFAKRSDLAGLSSKSDVEALRKLTGEFQNELNTLGVDVDGIKKRLDGLDGRVKKLEDAMAKLPKISGNFDVIARANGRGAGTTGISSLLDRDGYLVSGVKKTPLNDARALHDFNIDITATPDEKTTLGVRLNYGNYLSYVTNAAGNRGAGANLTQQTTIWKAGIATTANLPILGETKLNIGRVPTQFTPYTFKLVDPDTYVSNENTDSGNIPVDGLVADAKVGSFGIKAIAAKVDPINLASNIAGGRSFTVGATTAGGSTTGPVGLPFNAGRTGSASIEQIAGAHVTLPTILGTELTATGLAFGTPTVGSQAYVYGATASRKLVGFGVNAAYTRSENANAASRTKNEAIDASASRSFGKINLTGGYRKIDPNFNAPGSWERLGTYQNPTSIKGYYGKASLPVGKLAVGGEYHQYDFGVSDEITNVRGNVALGLGGTSALELAAEQNKFKTGNVKQNFVNVGYSTQISTATSFRLGYQLLDYKNQPATLAAKGNVITGQFSVKF